MVSLAMSGSHYITVMAVMGVSCKYVCCCCVCSPAEAAGTVDWEDPLGKELYTSGIKAYGRAKLQVHLWALLTAQAARLCLSLLDVCHHQLL